VAFHGRQQAHGDDAVGTEPGGERGVVLCDQPAVAEGRDAGGRGDRRPVVEPQRPDAVHEDPHAVRVPEDEARHASGGFRRTAARRTLLRWASTATTSGRGCTHSR
jgi:hypothetical protein